MTHILLVSMHLLMLTLYTIHDFLIENVFQSDSTECEPQLK